jgi:nucleoside-diphosphate-sugar epimerase
MDVLITGATGFIGSNLAEYLRASGASVHALVRDPGRIKLLAGLDVHVLGGDLFHVPELPEGLTSVFHLAGTTKSLKPEPYYTVNRDGTASLIEAVLRQGLRPSFIYLSSLSACGPSAPGAGRRLESDPPAPLTHYGKSKLAGEAEVIRRRDALPVAVARVGAVYGPRDAEFARYFRLVKRGLVPVPGRTATPLGLCYVKDLCRGLGILASHPAAAGEIFNFGDPAASSLEDLGRRAAVIFGRKPRRIIVPLPIARAIIFAGEAAALLTGKPTILNRQKYQEYAQPGWVADVGKAKALLGFETKVSLDDGLRETIDWYRANGWL